MKKIFFFVIITLLFSCKKEVVKFSLNVTLNPPECGLVNPISGEYENGETVVINVTPDEYYEFNWSGDWSGIENPLNIIMDGDKNLTVNFILKDTDGDGVTDDVDQCPTTPAGYSVDENGCKTPLYYDENGITIKCLNWAIVGETYKLDGEYYKIVDNVLLRSMISNDEDISIICTTKTTDMYLMFNNSDFNGDISTWDMSNVTRMARMFSGSQFNGDISEWNVSNVTDMTDMFSGSKFNGDISKWDVGNVNTMERMFLESQFTGDILNWDVSNVWNMSLMFTASIYNGDISKWNVGKVTNMAYMFSGSKFNRDISNWNVSNVTKMEWMFNQSEFNGDISNWDVSSVTNMYQMFSGNQYFNRDLSNWDVANVTNCTYFNVNTPQWTLPKPNFTNCDCGCK